MKDTCKVIIKLFDEVGNLYYNDITPFDVYLEFYCDWIDTADFKIIWCHKIRKLHKIEIREWDTKRIFKWIVYDWKKQLSTQIITVKANSEKWFFKQLFTTAQYTNNTNYAVFVADLLLQQNTLYNQRIWEYWWFKTIQLDISAQSNLYDTFDQIAELAKLERTVDWSKVIFWNLWKDTGIKLVYNAWCWNNDLELEVSEWDRASYVFMEWANWLYQFLYNYSQGNLWMVKKKNDLNNMTDINAEINKCLAELQGKNTIYEVTDITANIDVNVCDTISLSINDCDEVTVVDKIKVQKKTIKYTWWLKQTKYTLSNATIKFKNRFWYFLK